MSDCISTERLELIPMTPAFLRASLERGAQGAGQHLNAALPAEWPGEFADVVSLRLQQLEDEPALQPWLLRAMVLRETSTMIGHIGFHTAPGADYLIPFSPGAVEFGFTVFPPFRRQGYAREASITLMRWATEVHHVSRFIVTIRPDNLASQALAAQLGFARIGSHMDEVDGLEEVLEYRVPNELSILA